ncbi:hypothetical protein K474DRAFT_1773855 [Panus rudis PR-1116 ss-1]|nr:hypothetical protein K474DRAFT_1773855 [Panus rudis PR-1116 ss-1]
MKRGAERQLSKEDAEEEVEENEPGQGFRKADERVLAGRQIRGLPRRVAGAAHAAPPAPVAESNPPPAAPKFSGFGGFGAGSSTPFSFAAPASPASNKQPAPTTSPFFSGNNSSSTLQSGVSSSSSVPSVSASASNATKTFASFLNNSATGGSSSAFEPKATTPAPAPETDTSNEDEIKAETKYLTALRGLNASFLSAVSKAVESDPFLDVADLLEKYKAHRISVQSEYEDTIKKLKPSASKSTADPPAAPPNPFKFGKTAESSSSSSAPEAASSKSAFPSSNSTSSTPAMPQPPSGAFSFNATSSAKPMDAPVKPISFTPSSTSSTSTRSAFTFAGSSPASSSGAAGNDSASSAGGPSASKSAFSCGSSSMSTSDSTSASSAKPFTFGSSASSGSPSVFSSNIFAKPESDKMNEEDDRDEKKDSNPTSAFSSAFSTNTNTNTNASPSNPFGISSSASNPFASGISAFSTPEKDKPSSSSAFNFGKSSSSSNKPVPSLFAGFGAAPVKPAAGNLGNPVGFGFGSPPKTPEKESAPSTGSAAFTFGKPASSAFSFGKPPTTENKEKEGEGNASEDAPPVSLVTSSSIHDQEGEGEENEVTTHEIRSKVYKMVKKSDGGQEWGDMGVGVLRLKRHKENDARRVLLRNSSTGKIVINFNIHAGMNPTISKNVVSFLGHDYSEQASTPGAPTPFKIRMKTEEQANALKSAIDREIEFVQGKTEGTVQGV